MTVDEFRFLPLSTNTAFENMAIDEAIMHTLRDREVPPTLRLYRWSPSAVSIGTFQSMTGEVDLEYCKTKGIDSIRRITGGGAVYHDFEGEVTYSIILPKGHKLVPDDIIKSYEVLCSGIISGLSRLGIDSEFKPINDIVAAGKKISGNAQTRRHRCVLQHGTVLLDLDVKVMFSVLKVPEEKISDKMISDVKQRVTSIRDILGTVISITSLADALRDGFSESLGIELIPGELTPQEKQFTETFRKNKYSTDGWNLSR